MGSLTDIEGIGERDAQKLQQAGIRSANALLKQAANRKGRKDLAEKSGISEKLILEWVNLADLYRIKGIGSEFSDLLEEAGVDSVPELARRTASSLHQKILAINTEKKLTRRVPTEGQVAAWIEEAKTLPRIVEH